MTMPHNPLHNPFVLPAGLGQTEPTGAASTNPLMAGLDMMREAWASLAGAGGLSSSLAATVPMSLTELDRRIAELRTVENWLKLNQAMLASTLQGLEVQRATIATLQAFMGDPARGIEGVAENRGEDGGSNAATHASAAAHADTAQQWWQLMQQQFQQLTQAAAATMSATADGGAATQPASAPKTSPQSSKQRKPRSKRQTNPQIKQKS